MFHYTALQCAFGSEHFVILVIKGLTCGLISFPSFQQEKAVENYQQMKHLEDECNELRGRIQEL